MILHYVKLTREEDNRGGGRYWQIPEHPHSPLACLIAHEALFQGELVEPTPGYTYAGMDERGLPTHFQVEDGVEWESWELEEVA